MAGRSAVGIGWIIWFGFTVGLMPCPAVLAVLLICLQLMACALGMAMVAAFSLGIAATMIALGVIAALSLKAISRRASLGRWIEKLPHVSAPLIFTPGTVISDRGLATLGLVG